MEKNVTLSSVSHQNGEIYRIDPIFSDYDQTIIQDKNVIRLKTKSDMYSKFKMLLPFLFEKNYIYKNESKMISLDNVFDNLKCNYPLSTNVEFYDYDIITNGDGKCNIRPVLVRFPNGNEFKIILTSSDVPIHEIRGYIYVYVNNWSCDQTQHYSINSFNPLLKWLKMRHILKLDIEEESPMILQLGTVIEPEQPRAKHEMAQTIEPPKIVDISTVEKDIKKLLPTELNQEVIKEDMKKAERKINILTCGMDIKKEDIAKLKQQIKNVKDDLKVLESKCHEIEISLMSDQRDIDYHKHMLIFATILSKS